MSNIDVVAETSQYTVVSEYTPLPRQSEAYQSEYQLEQEFINMLSEQGYDYITIRNEKALIDNLRVQLEKLNDYTFSNDEWDRFFNGCIANSNDGIVEKTRRIQEDFIQVLKCDDGSTKNIYLIRKDNVHKNSLQVINQYEVSQSDGASHNNRYDVTVLVNGFPMVHIELKRRGVALREAFNQIERYQRDSFWAGCGLYEYIQIFVISNGTNTKYYSNTTRFNAVKECHSRKAKKSKTSNSFEFTSFWADTKNKTIPDLVDFTRTFFAKHTILNILTKYCVFTSENMLLVMRPYQITATEMIINRIKISNTYKKYGSVHAGGYIWHTTGSGKTLTSFKTARLASSLPYIDKVLFVVDRKDLDYQTMKEYDRFEKGSANSNTSTNVLKRQLEKSDCRIIITTIQKLSTFIRKNKFHDVYDKQVIIIFDECHRSQFGDMHKTITKTFKKYYLFGFTGTPIFAENAKSTSKSALFTTEQTFGAKLHTYTIVDAIRDKNVLPFRVDFVSRAKMKDDVKDKQVYDIDREETYMKPERIEKVTKYILDHFAQKTYQTGKSYKFNKLMNISEVATGKRGISEEKATANMRGFNSIFAVSSIEAAKLYYTEFKKQMDQMPSDQRLRIATIFSYSPNEEESDGIDEENPESTAELDQSSRDFLDSAISDYNEMFKTKYSTDGELFQNYYKDVSLRMKNKELDMLIVVNMFLTGFDATTLNTLWVDKNLKMHGLIQAFSRTNRILNSIKRYGNIVCFRQLQNQVDKALSVFGDENAGGVVLIKTFNEYYYGYKDEQGNNKKGYADMIAELQEKYPVSETEITGEKNQKEFVKLFGAILRMRNLLSSFDDFSGMEILTEREMQDYLGKYQDIYEMIHNPQNTDKENVNDDIVFEMELVKQIEINIDYILMLVAKYHHSNCQDKEILVDIKKAVESSPELRSKKALIEAFIGKLADVNDVVDEWQTFVKEEKEKEITSIIQQQNLKPEETRIFIDNAFRDGEIKVNGTDIDSIMPPVSRFGGKRKKTKEIIIEILQKFFDKYFGI